MMKDVKHILLRAILIVGAAAILAYGVYSSNTRLKLDYNEHLSDVAVTVDGEDLTLGDLYFYVLYEEMNVEDTAAVYNEKRTKDFWNIHINGIFIQAAAKKAVMGMAVHDHIFYKAAMDEGLVLSTEEKKAMEDARTDFWSDLYDEQKDNMPVDYEVINEAIRRVALAEKYQRLYANENNLTLASLAWDGYDYEVILNDHKVKTNKRIWDRVVIGDVTLDHENVGYINGYHKDEESEK